MEKRARPVPKPRTRVPSRASQVTEESSCEPVRTTSENQSSSLVSHDCGNIDDLYDSRKILVKGLNGNTTRDALWNYMEVVTTKSIGDVKFLGQGRAVVNIAEPLQPQDFNGVVKKVSGRMLEGQQLSVEQIGVCDSIRVTSLSPQVTRDAVLLHFESTKRSGGGTVKDVDFSQDSHCAIVVFEDPQVVDSVVSKIQTLEGEQAQVERYCPQINPQTTVESNPAEMMPISQTTDHGTHERQEKQVLVHDVVPERTTIDIEVDDDIMQHITSSSHASAFQEKLHQLKAEFEWNPGNKAVTVLKEIGSGYVEKWGKRCHDAVCEFLDQFVKFSITLSDRVANIVDEVLPRLQENLRDKKVFCKLDEGKNSFYVVCLEGEQSDVQQSIERFLEIVEEEEVRKTYIKETFEDISYERVRFLQHIKFVEEMERKYPELKLTLDFEQPQVHMEGPREGIKNCNKEYNRIMYSMAEESLALPAKCSQSIITSQRGMRYFQEKFAVKNITAMVFESREDNKVIVVGRSVLDFQNARECLDDSMTTIEVTIDDENTSMLESEKWKAFVRRLGDGRLIEISTVTATEKSRIVLLGMLEDVDDAKKEIDEFIEEERMRSKILSVPDGLARFLAEKRPTYLRNIEDRLKKSCVSIFIDRSDVRIKGTRTGVEECTRNFLQLCDNIYRDQKKFKSPGLLMLMSGESGKRTLKSIEIVNDVIIEVIEERKPASTETEEDEEKSIHEDGPRVHADKKERDDEPRAPRQPRTSDNLYDRCNFTTKEGLKVSWKFGSIETEKADVLVNSANSNLTNLTACGKALARVGGKSFTDACQTFTNVGSGEIACTPGGNLSCTKVIHAVCCNWNNGNAETVLRGLVRKILMGCIELRATSVAIPLIGMGNHKFPKETVIQVYEEEIKEFSQSNRPENVLKEICIVVFKASKPPETSTSLPVKNPVTNSSGNPPVVTKATGYIYDLCSFTTKEGIKVSWKFGNIEKEQADVLVNSATSDLNNPTACGKSLNSVGGPAFIQACKQFNNIGEGNIACTPGGALSCKKVLHAVCCDWKKGKGKAEQVLRKLMSEILTQCTSLGASSVALPTIGTGEHKFPENKVLEIYKDEIEKFSAKYFNQSSLRNIRIIVFIGKRPIPQPVSSSSSTSLPTGGQTRVISFGQVQVSLHEGNITQPTTASDALMNLLPHDSKLTNGGGVCKSILNTGGQGIQNQLDAAGSLPLGSLVRTDAGSMSSYKHIFHIIPSSNDVPGLQSSVLNFLNKAKAQSLRTVAIPAIGTASFNITPGDCAELILNAAKDFSNASTNYPLVVNIFVFQKNMIADFEAKIYQKSNAATSQGKPAPTGGQVPTATAARGPPPPHVAPTGGQVPTAAAARGPPQPPAASTSGQATPTTSVPAKATTTSGQATQPATKQPQTSSTGGQGTATVPGQPQATPATTQVAAASNQPHATTNNSANSTVTSTASGNQSHVDHKKLKTKDRDDVILFNIIASSKELVHKSFREVKEFIDEHMRLEKFEHEKHFDVFSKNWPEIENLARAKQVSINCESNSKLVIKGPERSVSECKEELQNLIGKHEEEERKISQRKSICQLISKTVQWSCTVGNQSIDYDEEANATIEIARGDGKKSCQIIRNGETFDIDLNALTEKNKKNGTVSTIHRKVIGDDKKSYSGIPLPSSWSPQQASQLVSLITLPTSSSEYQQVLNHFRNKGGTASQIIKIERVQNPGLYKAYLVKKESMKGAENEQQLFHGTAENSTVAINTNNFSRSYAGINGTAYGNGVYFARDAKYSLNYAKAGQSGQRCMYVAKVLVGKYTAGASGMKAPPSRNDPSNPGLLYDSVVNNPANPSIFVIFQDHQCYPEYLITFK